MRVMTIFTLLVVLSIITLNVEAKIGDLKDDPRHGKHRRPRDELRPPPPEHDDPDLPFRDRPFKNHLRGHGPGGGRWRHSRHRGDIPLWVSTLVAFVGLSIFSMLIGGILFYKRKEQALKKIEAKT